MLKFWKDHSLSITFTVGGTIVVLACIPLHEGTAFDLISGMGSAFVTTGLYGFASGPLVERNRPEEEKIKEEIEEDLENET